MQVVFAGAATAATVVLLSAVRPCDTDTAVATGPQIAQTAPNMVGDGKLATDGDDTFVNDNGQTPGDIFTQNAQDQSTA